MQMSLQMLTANLEGRQTWYDMTWSYKKSWIAKYPISIAFHDKRTVRRYKLSFFVHLLLWWMYEQKWIGIRYLQIMYIFIMSDLFNSYKQKESFIWSQTRSLLKRWAFNKFYSFDFSKSFSDKLNNLVFRREWIQTPIQ